MRSATISPILAALLLPFSCARAAPVPLYPPFGVGYCYPVRCYYPCTITYPCCPYYLYPLGYLIDPREEALWQLRRGQELFRYNRLDDALVAFRASLRQKSDVADTYFWRGYALQELDEPAAAAESYRVALRLGYPYRAVTHNNLAGALASLGHWQEAVREYRAALEESPDFRAARENLHAATARAEVALKLPAILDGQGKPANPEEAALLAEVAGTGGLVAESTRLWQQALAGGHNRDHLVLAARTALQGDPSADSGARRKLALAWLNEDLSRRRSAVREGNPGAVEDTRQTLRQWQQDSILRRVRDASATRPFLPAEREDWERLWADVADLMRTADILPAGRWEREGRELVQKEKGDAPWGQIIYFGDAVWDNYSVEVETRTEGGEFGLAVRALDPRTRLLIVLDGKDNVAHRILTQTDASPLRILRQAERRVIRPGRWQKVRAQLLANTVRVTVDDREVFMVEFAGFERGKVGLWANGPVARFRNLVVTSRGGDILYRAE